MALWRLLDYIDLYRTPLYIMLLRYGIISKCNIISNPVILLSFIRGRERLSPEPGPGEISLNKSLLAASLNCELEELRQEILKKRRGEPEIQYHFQIHILFEETSQSSWQFN